ncbi:MAG: hypothetical protein LWW85_11455 [Marinilabiliales bacterium]|nr:hypothetical protein [Marinilabiliales bacterium]
MKKDATASFASMSDPCFRDFPFLLKAGALLLFLFLTFGESSLAQSDNKVSVEVNADFVSRYIWRGTDIGNGPAIQPGATVTWKNFTLGTWASYPLNGKGEAETDFYLSKTIGFAKIDLWDYWSFGESGDSRFWDYREATTSHLLEAQLLLSGNDKLPFHLLMSYLCYGADPSRSLYLELQYDHKTEYADFSAFAGLQAKGNYYADKAGFVNIGCTARKSIVLSDKFSLPLSVSLIHNPSLQKMWLVATISF